VLVRGDSEQLMRVVGNLLSNALKFCPAGGRVEVTLAGGAGQDVSLRVDDTGPGIAPNWRTRIFDRFSQMGSDATRGREGAGLGLALCREVAELHGGRLYATDSVLGGAGFVFELPSPARSLLSDFVDNSVADCATQADHREDNSHPKAESVASPPQPSGASDGDDQVDLDSVEHGDIDPHLAKPVERPLVLLAEDNDDLRYYLAGVLEQDYRVVVAADGEQALEQARAEAPDLIVTDLMMPKRDGVGLAHAVRANDELAGVPIIFLTARAADHDRIAGLDGGADYYLTKPFDSRVLLAQLGAALRACQRLRQRYAVRTATADPESAGAPGKSEFAARIEALFEVHAHDPEFSVLTMVDALHLSQTALSRHCRNECQATPGELLRRYRLQRAHGLLEQGAGNVSEVAYAVGYSSLSTFSRAYREQYGHSPTQSRRQH
jgi:DNA-binding response OmpR family regulator